MSNKSKSPVVRKNKKRKSRTLPSSASLSPGDSLNTIPLQTGFQVTLNPTSGPAGATIQYSVQGIEIGFLATSFLVDANGNIVQQISQQAGSDTTWVVPQVSPGQYTFTVVEYPDPSRQDAIGQAPAAFTVLANTPVPVPKKKKKHQKKHHKKKHKKKHKK
jgi:hypothetical protein